jgi:F0F1-type ATP synthase gamma subunit
MNIKSVVKVMNFHALLRVDKARKQADILGSMQAELEKMIQTIVGNRNLRLDKVLRLPDSSLPALRIYMGSDYGFCGSVNSSVSNILAKDPKSEKLVIGKKVRNKRDVTLSLTWDEYYQDITRVRDYFIRAVRDREWSAVDLVYNRYDNIGNIRLDQRRIYPMNTAQFDQHGVEGANVDYIIESNIMGLLEEMLIAYLFYEFRICVTSAYAAENTMRQSATQESLKKLDEREIEELRVERKLKNEISFRKTIDGYTRQRLFTSR